MGKSQGGSIFLRFQKGGSKKNKAGLRRDHLRADGMRVVWGAKVKNCTPRNSVFNSGQNMVNEENVYSKLQ